MSFLFQALHHPFTAPNPEDMKDLSSARALAYDMVYNGVEVFDCFPSGAPFPNYYSINHLQINNQCVASAFMVSIRLVAEV